MSYNGLRMDAHASPAPSISFIISICVPFYLSDVIVLPTFNENRQLSMPIGLKTFGGQLVSWLTMYFYLNWLRIYFSSIY